MSVKIYKLTDRVEVKIGEVVFSLSPLSWSQKQEIMSLANVASGDVNEMTRKATFRALKYSIKGISGVEYADGDSYKLIFDEDGTLSECCIEELLNMEICPKLIISCYAMIQGVPSDIIDPSTGLKVEGVEVVKSKGKQAAKSKK